MRLGIIGSSGGAALSAAVACLADAKKHLEVVVATDRECGISRWAQVQGYDTTMIPYTDAHTFSNAALAYFKARNVQCALLFFTRLVAAPLIGGLPTYNIHPSLLPSFPGLLALRQALAAKVRILGATLHVVNDRLDAGSIVAQISSGLPSIDQNVAAAKISYLQKVYLTLVLYELINNFGMTIDFKTEDVTFNAPPPSRRNASPCLSDSTLVTVFDSLQQRESCQIV
jgi:folate-dependent phosphoribosylglycinamide formyltransferase PurN